MIISYTMYSEQGFTGGVCQVSMPNSATNYSLISLVHRWEDMSGYISIKVKGYRDYEVNSKRIFKSCQV